LGGVEVFREILENAPKFQNGIRGLREQKGFELGFLTRGSPMVLKVIYRGD
jgi:hypothetical protein